MPWYEREDFAELWEFAKDRDDILADYERWKPISASGPFQRRRFRDSALKEELGEGTLRTQ